VSLSEKDSYIYITSPLQARSSWFKLFWLNFLVRDKRTNR
jgi:hypothetical protein